ncbi:MAG: hypothetical protein ACRDSE_05835, partial [Pseudonocardiaceae bacterium]
MVHRCADKLASQMAPAPEWFTGFGVVLAQRTAPTRAVSLLHQLAELLAHTSHTPTAVLQAAQHPAPAVGALARALEAYFVASRLALPLDTSEQGAALRRARRVAETPPVFRSLVAAFDAHQLDSRERARRAGTKPRSDRTLEINLTATRDLALFLTAHRPDVSEWTLVGVADIDAFLATFDNAGYRARQLHALQGFFRFVRRDRHILVDPTHTLKCNSNAPFHGEVLQPARQRDLFRRWTTDAAELHPHEPTVGLLGLLHGASVHELRSLHVTHIDLDAATVKLGRRPQPTPLDPATIAALHRCIEFHKGHGKTNTHLLVSQKSKTTGDPVSVAYLAKLLTPASVTAQALRATRLAHLVTVMDPVLVATAFGIRRGAALHYLADTVVPLGGILGHTTPLATRRPARARCYRRRAAFAVAVANAPITTVISVWGASGAGRREGCGGRRMSGGHPGAL